MRQYTLSMSNAGPTRAQRGPNATNAGPTRANAPTKVVSLGARQLAAARDTVAGLDFDTIGPVTVFYLAGAGRDVRAARAAEGIAVDELQGRLFAPESQRGWSRTVAGVGEQLERARTCEPGAWHVEHRADDGILAVGVDTLYTSAETYLCPRIVEQLEALRTIARESDAGVYVGAGTHLWQVMPHGRHPYCVVLRGRASTIMVKRSQSSKSNPQTYIEYRSDWLWRDGPDRCVATVSALLRRWTDDKMRSKLFKVSVSRIDMAVDVDGRVLDLRGDELLRGCWLTRARGKTQYYRGELAKMGLTDDDATAAQKRSARAAADRTFDSDRQFAEFYSGLVYTGIAMGRSGIGVRMYRKDIHLDRPGIHKPYQRALWLERGWDGESPVWRVEFTIMGDKLRELAAKARKDVAAGLTAHLQMAQRRAGAWIAGNDWASVQMSLGALWRVCTGDPKLDAGGWLSLRVESSNRQRTRWPIDDAWRLIQSVRWQLGSDAAGLEHVDGKRVRKVRAGDVGPLDLDALAHARPGAWEACQPIAPGGDPLADVLDMDNAQILRRWGHGPATAEEAALFDVEVTSAESRLKQIMPQLIGCMTKVLAELKISGIDRPTFDDAMMRVALELPDDLDGEVDAKAAAIAINGARQMGLRRAAA